MDRKFMDRKLTVDCWIGCCQRSHRDDDWAVHSQLVHSSPAAPDGSTALQYEANPITLHSIIQQCVRRLCFCVLLRTCLIIYVLHL